LYVCCQQDKNRGHTGYNVKTQLKNY